MSGRDAGPDADSQMNEKAGGIESRAPPVLIGPERAKYSISGLLSCPARVLHPPKLECPELTPTVGQVQSFKRTPVTHVTLDAMLGHKGYLPPFTLREFEDYLVFHEHSVENLYATVWCRQYVQDYEANKAGQRGAKSDADLKKDFEAGIATFFTPGVKLEANLPSNLRNELLIDASKSHHVAVLLPAKAAVEEHLRESLVNFVKYNLGNAGAKRQWFALVIGAATFLLGIGFVVLFCLLPVARGWRAFALPLYWLGATTFYGGRGRSCIVLFLFGAVRQLHPWETERPRQATRQSADLPPTTPVLNREGSPSIMAVDDPEKALSTIMSRPDNDSASGSLAWFPMMEPEAGSPHLPPTYTASIASSSKKSGPATFAPITAVQDPLAVRTQRDRIVSGAAWSLLLTALMAAPTFAVPNRG